MQDQYVGDVGDFGKYGLLRYLCGLREDSKGPSLSLGVVWYLMPNGGGNDGKHLSYLHHPPKNRHRDRFRGCDDLLYESLYDIIFDGAYPEVQKGRRTVSAIQGASILRDAVFFDDPLTVDGLQVDRTAWSRDAITRLNHCDVVFADPDNGLELPSGPGPKHASFSELGRYLQNGRSLVVYHHLSRNGSADDQIRSCASQLRERLGIGGDIISLRYRRGTARAFFIIPNGRERVLNERIDAFLDGPWGREKVGGRPHFQRVS